jgi:pimeloyl-ACP methyl ester carboxylesterase
MKPFDNSQFIIVNDIKFHVRCFASKGETLHKMLLLHGFGSHTYAFRKTVPALIEAGVSCLCVDVPPWGYGHRKVVDQITLTSLLWKLLSIIDNENLNFSSQKKWLLCGHSMGGVVTLNMAANCRELVDKIILISPALKAPYPRPLLMLARPFTSLSYKLLLKFKPIYFLLTKRSYRAHISKEEMLNTSKPLYDLGVPGDLGDVYLDGFNLYSFSEVDSIDKLLLWADEDKVLGRKIPEIVNKVVKCKCYKIKSGHCSMETHSDEVNHIILDFLN